MTTLPPEGSVAEYLNSIAMEREKISDDHSSPLHPNLKQQFGKDKCPEPFLDLFSVSLDLFLPPTKIADTNEDKGSADADPSTKKNQTRKLISLSSALFTAASGNPSISKESRQKAIAAAEAEANAEKAAQEGEAVSAEDQETDENAPLVEQAAFITEPSADSFDRCVVSGTTLKKGELASAATTNKPPMPSAAPTGGGKTAAKRVYKDSPYVSSELYKKPEFKHIYNNDFVVAFLSDVHQHHPLHLIAGAEEKRVKEAAEKVIAAQLAEEQQWFNARQNKGLFQAASISNVLGSLFSSGHSGSVPTGGSASAAAQGDGHTAKKGGLRGFFGKLVSNITGSANDGVSTTNSAPSSDMSIRGAGSKPAQAPATDFIAPQRSGLRTVDNGYSRSRRYEDLVNLFQKEMMAEDAALTCIVSYEIVEHAARWAAGITARDLESLFKKREQLLTDSLGLEEVVANEETNSANNDVITADGGGATVTHLVANGQHDNTQPEGYVPPPAGFTDAPTKKKAPEEAITNEDILNVLVGRFRQVAEGCDVLLSTALLRVDDDRLRHWRLHKGGGPDEESDISKEKKAAKAREARRQARAEQSLSEKDVTSPTSPKPQPSVIPCDSLKYLADPYFVDCNAKDPFELPAHLRTEIGSLPMVNLNSAPSSGNNPKLYQLPEVTFTGLTEEHRTLEATKIGIHGGRVSHADKEKYSQISPFGVSSLSAPTPTPCLMCTNNYWDPSLTLNRLCESAFTEQLLKSGNLRLIVANFITECLEEIFYGELEEHDKSRKTRVRKLNKKYGKNVAQTPAEENDEEQRKFGHVMSGATTRSLLTTRNQDTSISSPISQEPSTVFTVEEAASLEKKKTDKIRLLDQLLGIFLKFEYKWACTVIANALTTVITQGMEAIQIECTHVEKELGQLGEEVQRIDPLDGTSARNIPSLLRARTVGDRGESTVSLKCRKLSAMIVRFSEACTHMISASTFAKKFRENARHETIKLKRALDRAAANQSSTISGGRQSHLSLNPDVVIDMDHEALNDFYQRQRSTDVGSAILSLDDGASYQAKELLSIISSLISPLGHNEGKRREMAATAVVEGQPPDLRRFSLLPDTPSSLLSWMLECETSMAVAKSTESRSLVDGLHGKRQSNLSDEEDESLHSAAFMVQSDHRMTPLRALYSLSLIANVRTASTNAAHSSFIPVFVATEVCPEGMSVFHTQLSEAIEHQFSFLVFDALSSVGNVAENKSTPFTMMINRAKDNLLQSLLNEPGYLAWREQQEQRVTSPMSPPSATAAASTSDKPSTTTVDKKEAVFKSRILPAGVAQSPYLFHKHVLTNDEVFSYLVFHPNTPTSVTDFQLTDALLDAILVGIPALTEMLRYALIGTCGLGNTNFKTSGAASKTLIDAGIGKRLLMPMSAFLVFAVDRLGYRSEFSKVQVKAPTSGDGTSADANIRDSKVMNTFLQLTQDHVKTYEADVRAASVANRKGDGLSQRVTADGSAIVVSIEGEDGGEKFLYTKMPSLCEDIRPIGMRLAIIFAPFITNRDRIGGSIVSGLANRLLSYKLLGSGVPTGAYKASKGGNAVSESLHLRNERIILGILSYAVPCSSRQVPDDRHSIIDPDNLARYRSRLEDIETAQKFMPKYRFMIMSAQLQHKVYQGAATPFEDADDGNNAAVGSLGPFSNAKQTLVDGAGSKGKNLANRLSMSESDITFAAVHTNYTTLPRHHWLHTVGRTSNPETELFITNHFLFRNEHTVEPSGPFGSSKIPKPPAHLFGKCLSLFTGVELKLDDGKRKKLEWWPSASNVTLVFHPNKKRKNIELTLTLPMAMILLGVDNATGEAERGGKASTSVAGNASASAAQDAVPLPPTVPWRTALIKTFADLTHSVDAGDQPETKKGHPSEAFVEVSGRNSAFENEMLLHFYSALHSLLLARVLLPVQQSAQQPTSPASSSVLEVKINTRYNPSQRKIEIPFRQYDSKHRAATNIANPKKPTARHADPTAAVPMTANNDESPEEVDERIQLQAELLKEAEARQRQKEYEQNLRSTRVQIAIVRVLKNKVNDQAAGMSHQLLVSQVIAILQKDFLPEISDIKANIEKCIERELIERVEDGYRYKS